jgi:aminoglycoside phosphotransferase (APT) family kinase protein
VTVTAGPDTAGPDTAGPDPLGEGLRRVLAQLGRPAEVTGLHRLSGGASAETWAFDTTEGSDPADRTTRPYILRRQPPAGSDKATVTLEASVMAAAAAAGVPVPGVLTASDDVAVLGSPFMIMDRVEGETIPRRILRDDALAPARGRLAGDCGRILGVLHGVEPTALPGLVADDPLERYRLILDQLGAPSPTFEWAFRHLAATRPDPSPVGLVHGDFRLGNLMVGPEGVRAVLDWELVHLGDPLEDLGWLCTKAWRFGSPAPVGGVGSYADLLAGYAEATGRVVSLDTLRWWETLGSLKWGIMCLMQASFHLSGARPSVELAAIGRRVAENEWDLLELLP